MILDSAFADFKEVAKNTVGKMGIPAQFIDMLWPQIAGMVQQKTGMNMNELRPVDHCAKKEVPAFFIHGIEDELIPMDHTGKNFEAYKGSNKDVCYCDGTHNSERPDEVLMQCLNFLTLNLLSN